MPKVSVIVPNYNHAAYLEQRISSILNQTYQDFELIILDDFSTDNSKEIIERYRSNQKVSQIVYNEKNGGTSYKQWYKGIEFARGELIWIAESDDWCDERFLETLVPHFEKSDVSIVFCNTILVYPDDKIDTSSTLTGDFEMFQGVDFIRDKMLIGNGIGNASMAVFRRDRYNIVKDAGFKELKLCGDWLLWIQLLNGYKVIAIPDKLNYCRRHATNATSRFTTLGLDFIEAVKVLRTGKRICNYNFDRKLVYMTWLDRYYLFRSKFSKGVVPKIFLNILKYDPLMFLYFSYFIIYNIQHLKLKYFKNHFLKKMRSLI
jgi:glycosyltransferase involved in cell wall biosynthesis